METDSPEECALVIPQGLDLRKLHDTLSKLLTGRFPKGKRLVDDPEYTFTRGQIIRAFTEQGINEGRMYDVMAGCINGGVFIDWHGLFQLSPKAIDAMRQLLTERRTHVPPPSTVDSSWPPP